jgi:predicted nucleic acid-binding protein
MSPWASRGIVSFCLTNQQTAICCPFNTHAGRMAVSAITLAELLHIAAQARSEGLTLVSNNIFEFERVPALQLANWITP